MAASSKAQFLTEVHALLKKRYKLEPSRRPALRSWRRRLRDLPRGGHPRAGQSGHLAVQGRLLRLERGPGQLHRGDPGGPGRPARRGGAGPPRPPVPPPALREDLRLHPRRRSPRSPRRRRSRPSKEYEALGPTTSMATVIREALGGHAIPVDGPIRRGLERLGVADPGRPTRPSSRDPPRTRRAQESRAHEFVDLMEELTHDTCVPGPPDCPRCELRKDLPDRPRPPGRLEARRQGRRRRQARPARPASRPRPRSKPKSRPGRVPIRPRQSIRRRRCPRPPRAEAPRPSEARRGRFCNENSRKALDVADRRSPPTTTARARVAGAYTTFA